MWAFYSLAYLYFLRRIIWLVAVWAYYIYKFLFPTLIAVKCINSLIECFAFIIVDDSSTSTHNKHELHRTELACHIIAHTILMCLFMHNLIALSLRAPQIIERILAFLTGDKLASLRFGGNLSVIHHLAFGAFF